ncbi:hypothetical protein GCM10027290_44430 [Micromonospora sonneratiae]
MKIDSRVESIVRNTIYPAVISDFARLDKALQAFPDDETTRKAIELGLSIVYTLMFDIYEGKPSEGEIRGVAAEIVRAEAWARPTDEEVSAFLLRLMNGEPFVGVLPIESIIILTFVVAAHLLSSCRRDDEDWWDYLDRVEAFLENAYQGG